MSDVDLRALQLRLAALRRHDQQCRGCWRRWQHQNLKAQQLARELKREGSRINRE